MPELPEVECVVRRFRPLLAGRRIKGFAASWPRQVSPSVGAVRRAVVGRRIERVERRGKYIVLGLSDGTALLWHLKMSGRFEWAAACPEAPGHERARLDLEGGDALLFCDPRKFGRIRHAPDPAAALAALGREPLAADFTGAELARMLAGRRRRLKALLLDQGFLAGLGNIYCDEALWAAGLHPLRIAADLSPAEAHRLFRAMRAVLRRAICHNGTSIDWIYPGGRMQDYLAVYGRGGQACRRCGRPIQVLPVAGRTTHLCPACQPLPRRRAGGGRR